MYISLDFPSDHGRGGKGENGTFFFFFYQNTLPSPKRRPHDNPLNVKPRTRCRTLKSNHTAKFFERSDIWWNTFQGRTNHQTLSKVEQAPCTVKSSLRSGTAARPNLFQVKRKTKISLSAAVNTRPVILFYFILFYFIFFPFLFFYFIFFYFSTVFFFHGQLLPQVEHMTKKKFSVRTHDQKSTKTKILLRFNSRPNISSGRSHK